MSTSRPRIIDAHVHVFPDRVFEAIWRWFDKYGWDIRYRLYARDTVRFLLDRGIDRVIGLHYAHVPGMAESLNRFASELAKEEPRLLPCATVFPGEPDARRILDEALGKLGCRGIKIHCHVQRIAPDDARLDDVYDAARAHDVPVIIHTGDAPASPHYGCDVHALCDPSGLERALDKHSRTTVIVPHLGASPIERIANMLERHEHLYLDTTMTLGGSFEVRDDLEMLGGEDIEAWIERVVTVIRMAKGRVLYGTDFPNIPYEWDRELRKILSLQLPEDEQDALLWGTAARLFRIDEAAI